MRRYSIMSCAAIAHARHRLAELFNRLKLKAFCAKYSSMSLRNYDRREKCDIIRGRRAGGADEALAIVT